MTDDPRILVVDDDPVWFEHYFSELNWDGFVVDYACSIGEALQKLNETDYDVAVLDYRFRPEPESKSPEALVHELHDGIGLAIHIRKSWPAMVVIVASQAINEWPRKRFDFFREKGILVSQKRDLSPSRMRQLIRSSLDASRLRVFIVHGRDHETLQELVEGLHELGIRDVITLKDMPSSGMTLIEKFERCVDDIDIAFVLCTPDDIAGLKEEAMRTNPRSRQNVIFELGYLIGRLGRTRQTVVLLVKQPLELPSDISGVVYVDISQGVTKVLDELRREIEYGLLPNKANSADAKSRGTRKKPGAASRQLCRGAEGRKQMPASATESKRVRALRLSIVKEIPKIPNDRATKGALDQKSLGDLFSAYINWACRYVPPRPRKVSLEPAVTNDPRWVALRTAIDALLDKVRNGEDLTPYLSLLVHKHGFSPATAAKTPDVDRWTDKDFLLNVMGYHHFHLGLVFEPSGHVKRSDEIIFAAVTRDQFEALAIFDHSVFDKTDAVTNSMAAERNRLWEIFTERSSRGIPPGSVYVPAMIATSGHCWHHVTLAFDYSRIVRELDPKLDDPVFVKTMYEEAKITPPGHLKLKWHLNYLDLGLLDETQNVFLVLRYGPT